ncbi:uncharacterized protein LOC112526316 isoform X3 [Cynara cardunculus var. scolymus]|uniref:uncharacterized protein LOC112526316 isoform X3 n=1 Tax=Cynara cardunculus var. scolymus TaxID=59895 RepID=UPI000D625E68|nr:uncharacterized protein LOC112526316 isoform X3 [Cynara cardunculus var. scolymus]
MDPYAAQTYPPPSSSQIQPQNQDQYLYNQQYDQSQPYPYYPPIAQQQYPNPNPVYQQHPEQEPAPIHPPGVPIQNDPSHMAAYQHGYNTTHFQNDPYYPQPQQQQQLSYSDPGLVHQGQQQWQQQGQTADYGLTSSYPPNGQAQNSGSGRGGGRGFRGGGSSFHGRGRGRGRGGKTTIGQPKPPCMAWCELCRVDCNTLEILENHKNGKKHKKNLKVQEELQKLAAAKTQETQMAAPEKPENSGLTKVESQVVESQEQGSGLKRKMRDGERKSAEPSKKPKEIIPFICELCDVKCESAPTFDSHLKGKKHAFNLQRFQEQQASLGQAALQALYPALEALYPALLQALSQTNANASTSAANGGLDQQVLQWLQAYLPQTGPAVLPQGPESARPPTFEAQGPNQEAPIEEGANQVEPTVKTEDQVEPMTKTEEKVEPMTKTEEKVEPESKAAETNQ